MNDDTRKIFPNRKQGVSDINGLASITPDSGVFTGHSADYSYTYTAHPTYGHYCTIWIFECDSTLHATLLENCSQYMSNSVVTSGVVCRAGCRPHQFGRNSSLFVIWGRRVGKKMWYKKTNDVKQQSSIQLVQTVTMKATLSPRHC